MIRINKKTLSILAALMIGATPLASASEVDKNDNSNNNQVEFVLVKTAKNLPITLTMFNESVYKIYNEITWYFNYGDSESAKQLLLGDIECLYYLVNRTYFDNDTEDYLIMEGYISNNYVDTIMNANRLLNAIAVYNQRKVRETNNYIEVLDISTLCYQDFDREVLSDASYKWFNSEKNGEFNFEIIESLFRELVNVNPNGYNANNLSVGAKFLMQLGLGNNLMQVLRDYMQENYTQAELYRYFDQEKLNADQWVIRSDISLDPNCLTSELELCVYMFAELNVVCMKNVMNDLVHSFGNECRTK